MEGSLLELSADEFFDVYRIFRPDATREEFDAEWLKFQQAKAERQKKKLLQ